MLQEYVLKLLVYVRIFRHMLLNYFKDTSEVKVNFQTIVGFRLMFFIFNRVISLMPKF
jgi:hypothetical protein